MRRAAGRIALWSLGGLILLAVLAFLSGAAALRASLPRLTGKLSVTGLAAPVTVERDSLGVPTIRAAGRRDAAFALGFLHAQERFFQMDLERRQAAGELAALVGGMAVKWDSLARRQAFRAHARTALTLATPEDRSLLEAYAAGVNAGLHAQRQRPLEYLLLRERPRPWQPEDSYLVLYAMYGLLYEERESSLQTLYATLPRPLADFLSPRGGPWDAPLIGEPWPAEPVPGPEVLDLRGRPSSAEVRHDAPRGGGLGALPGLRGAARPHPRRRAPDLPPGSNCLAVAGTRTADGGALLADDMHLGLSVPNIWYRAVLVRHEGGEQVRLVGVTLPGVPGVIAGSNGHLAWGFTNAMADIIDLVIVEPDPADTTRYLTPDGPRPFGHRREAIAVRGAAPDTVTLLDTEWGPVIGRDWRGRNLAMRWAAYDPAAANLGLLGLETARGVDEAVALAPRCGIPPQNLICADDHGRIAWTVVGRLPRRVGFDGRLPVSWADGSCRWDGWQPPGAYPKLVDPPEGLLWTANNRTTDGAAMAAVATGGYIHGGRARQIRDDLRALEKPGPRDLLGIQLDDRALLLDRWRTLLLGVLTPEAIAGSRARAECRRLVADDWSGRASVESAGYRIVRGFRLAFREITFGWLTAPCAEADSNFTIEGLEQPEDALWSLATIRPPHLLDSRFPSWDEALLAAADTTVARLTRGGRVLAGRTWGERNTAAIRHPLSLAVHQLSRWLDMPRDQLPGDSNMPRVQAPDMGASERLVVSPGREEEGIFEMPSGESAHPLSPYFRGGHESWVRGDPTPLLPGRTRWTLRLLPAR